MMKKESKLSGLAIAICLYMLFSIGKNSFNSISGQKSEIRLFSNAELEIVDGTKEKTGGSLIFIYKDKSSYHLLYPGGKGYKHGQPIIVKKGIYKVLMACPKINVQQNFSFTLKVERKQVYTPYCIQDKSTNPPEITVSFDSTKRDR